MTYLDNNATTEIDPEVLDAMLPFLSTEYGNPSSAYRSGKRVADAVAKAREQVAALLGCEAQRVIFTSCGTESNNTALLSAMEADRDRQHLITTRVEHSAVTKHAERLSRKGFRVTWLRVDADGALDFEQLSEALDEETALVSVMWANNETGVIFPVEKIAEQAHAAGVLFHTDAVQMAGKLPLSVAGLPIDYLSISGHKLHCPKGVGALYLAPGVPYSNLLIGGGQEEGRRGGTENVASIVALGKAAEIALRHLETEQREVRAMRDQFEDLVLRGLGGVRVTGGASERLPNTSNLEFHGIEAEALLLLLDEKGICASSGSACTTGSLSPSHVLTAMGFDNQRARASLRFSFGRFNRPDQVEPAAAEVIQCVEKLRREAGGDSPVLMHRGTARA